MGSCLMGTVLQDENDLEMTMTNRSQKDGEHYAVVWGGVEARDSTPGWSRGRRGQIASKTLDCDFCRQGSAWHGQQA